MRISSQALKRAIRTSNVFRSPLESELGERTQRIGECLQEHLEDSGASPEKALEITRDIAKVFGKVKSAKDPNPTHTEQLAFVSPAERKAALELAESVLAGREPVPKAKELSQRILRKSDATVDIAMFGRMLADNPVFNRDASVQVAHAFTTHRMDIEDDYYTAVDDLKTPAEDAGAGFIGELGFGAGVFYLYVCVNRFLLLENLGWEHELAARGPRSTCACCGNIVTIGQEELLC